MPSTPPPPPPSKRGSIAGSHRIHREPRALVHARPSDYEHYVRIDAAGEVVSAHGNAQRLAALSAYACSLADTVGQLLDIGPALQVTATFAGGTLHTVRDHDGSIVGIKPYVVHAPARAVRARNPPNVQGGR